MSKKLLYVDCETTGLNAWDNGIIELSGIIEINGIIKDAFDYKIKPFKTDIIEEDALLVSGHKVEDLDKYSDPFEVYIEFKELLSKYVNPYDRSSERFLMVGYNVDFDYQFVKTYFTKIIDPTYNSCYNEAVDLIDNIIGADVSKDNIEWIKNFFIKNNDKFFTSFCRGIIDVRQLYTLHCILNNKSTANTRLNNACKDFDIIIEKEHSAKEDIKATYKLYKKILKTLGI